MKDIYRRTISGKSNQIKKKKERIQFHTKILNEFYKFVEFNKPELAEKGTAKKAKRLDPWKIEMNSGISSKLSNLNSLFEYIVENRQLPDQKLLQTKFKLSIKDLDNLKDFQLFQENVNLFDDLDNEIDNIINAKDNAKDQSEDSETEPAKRTKRKIIESDDSS